MNKIVSGIYSIKSITNNKQYIGSSVNIYKRYKDHKRSLIQNKHHSIHLQNHFNKYGENDLELTVIEMVEDTSLLLCREQHYIDSLKPEFNICLVAGSPARTKRSNSKYYSHFKRSNLYRTYYNIGGSSLNFSCHFNEEDAIKEVEYIKTLSTEELIEYSKECKAKYTSRTNFRSRNAKYYGFNKLTNRWMVKVYVNNKIKSFGSYLTEQEAIERVKELKQQSIL